MYHSVEVNELIDAKFFLDVDKDVCRSRREKREGYVTVDGFWSDPPLYFDRVVWPNFLRYNAHVHDDPSVVKILPKGLDAMIDRVASHLETSCNKESLLLYVLYSYN